MRAISNPARSAVQAQSTEKVFLACLIIDHPSFGSPFRFVSDFQNISSGGHTYTAWPFDLTLPAFGDTSLPQITITIDNVDESISQAIKGLNAPAPTVTVFIVLADSPDTVEVGPFVADLRSVNVTSGKITGTLLFEDLFNEPWPYQTFRPDTHPGLFA